MSTSRWVETNVSGRVDAWKETFTAFEVRDGGRVAIEWLHLDTGSRVLLTNDGSWQGVHPELVEEQGYPSRFRAFHMSPMGVAEISYALLGQTRTGGHFDPETGAEAYDLVLSEARIAIQPFLG